MKDRTEMKDEILRTLYECSNTRVKGNRIRCSRGHQLIERTEDGSIDARRLARGEPMAYRVCQDCPDFDSMGPPVPPHERGWINKKEAK